MHAGGIDSHASILASTLARTIFLSSARCCGHGPRVSGRIRLLLMALARQVSQSCGNIRSGRAVTIRLPIYTLPVLERQVGKYRRLPIVSSTSTFTLILAYRPERSHLMSYLRAPYSLTITAHSSPSTLRGRRIRCQNSSNSLRGGHSGCTVVRILII